MDKSSAPQPSHPPPYSENQGIPGVHQTFSGAPPPYQQQPPGYQTNYTVPPTGFVPSYGATQTHIIITPPIVAVGACPACRVGILEDDFTCLGLLCAILFFPIGILCCFALKNRRCSNCGAYFA